MNNEEVDRFQKMMETHTKKELIISSIEELFNMSVISSIEKELIIKKIDKFYENNNYYITKPFRTCGSIGKDLYSFMKSLSRNLRIIPYENQ